MKQACSPLLALSIGSSLSDKTLYIGVLGIADKGVFVESVSATTGSSAIVSDTSIGYEDPTYARYIQKRKTKMIRDGPQTLSDFVNLTWSQLEL